MIESQVFQLNVMRIVALQGERRAEAMGWNPVEALKIFFFFFGGGGGGASLQNICSNWEYNCYGHILIHLYSHSSQFISFCIDKSCQPNFFCAMIYFLRHS